MEPSWSNGIALSSGGSEPTKKNFIKKSLKYIQSFFLYRHDRQKIAKTFIYFLDTIAEHEATIDDLHERVKKMEELMSYSSSLQKTSN